MLDKWNVVSQLDTFIDEPKYKIGSEISPGLCMLVSFQLRVE